MKLVPFLTHRVAEQPQRQHRFSGPTLLKDEHCDQGGTGGGEPDDGRRTPGVLGAAPHGHQKQAGDGRDEQRGAEVVDGVGPAHERQAKHGAGDDQGEHPDGEVDVEHPPPRQMVHEEPADQRADHAGAGEHGAGAVLVAAPLPRRDEFADDGQRHRHQPARAESLHGAEGDQLAHGLGQPRHHRPGQEDDDGCWTMILRPYGSLILPYGGVDAVEVSR